MRDLELDRPIRIWFGEHSLPWLAFGDGRDLVVTAQRDRPDRGHQRVYGVDHNPAVAAVLLHQAIGLLVPLVGGGIAYMIIRRHRGPMRTGTNYDPG